MTSRFEKPTKKSELNGVVIENPNTPNVCVLYPAEVTDEQLETMWIRAEEGDYACVENNR